MKQPLRTQPVSELSKLRAEVARLRSFVIGVAGRDPEGAYRPQFVRRIQQAAQDTSTVHFEDADQFLDLLTQDN